MNKTFHVTVWSILLMSAVTVVTGIRIQSKRRALPAVVPAVVVQTPALDQTNQQYIAALDVARVFGRAPGCAEADAALIGKVATEALRTGIDPRILAATVAIESSCDSMAVSRRGAIGLTQVMPKIWKGSFDFEHTINLFNPNDNLHAGATILSGLIKQYGLAEGIRHYQGTGTDCDTCDNNYVPKILALAGRRQ
jgi:soluble lytic murein transglycosylase-like protein